MAKQTKVKWALGSGEPDDLTDFKDNSQIVNENKGLPPKGTYTFAVKRLAVKPNKNGDDRISAMLVMAEPKKAAGAPWNGYVVWEGFNVVDGPGLRFLKAFLKGLGLTWKNFLDTTKQDDQDPPHIVQIGGLKFEQGDDPTLRALVKIKPADEYNDAEHLEIQRVLPAGMDDEAGDDAAAEEDAVDVLSIDGEADAEPEGESLTLAMLDDMDLEALQGVAEQAGIKPKKFKGMKKKALRELIKEETNLPPF